MQRNICVSFGRLVACIQAATDPRPDWEALMVSKVLPSLARAVHNYIEKRLGEGKDTEDLASLQTAISKQPVSEPPVPRLTIRDVEKKFRIASGGTNRIWIIPSKRVEPPAAWSKE